MTPILPECQGTQTTRRILVLRPCAIYGLAPRGVLERDRSAGLELTASARAFLDAFVHKTLATLRRDGSPRISGNEVIFADGELWLGSMWQSLKARDLQRDPRFALHSGSPDPDAGWHGDAKVAGSVEENLDEELRTRVFDGKGGSGPSHLFRCDITELVVVSLPDPPAFLAIESWHEGRGVTRTERR